MPTDDAMVITATSRWATWLNSCASTASSSSSGSRRMMPRVAHTTAFLGLRPVAKALGTSVSATPTFGLGMPANAHSRSTMACSCGSCSGVTSLACIENIAILPENQYWEKIAPNMMRTTNGMATPTRNKMKLTATHKVTSAAPVRNIREVRPRSVSMCEAAMLTSTPPRSRVHPLRVVPRSPASARPVARQRCWTCPPCRAGVGCRRSIP